MTTRITNAPQTAVTGISYGSMRDSGALGLYSLAAELTACGIEEARVSGKVEIPEGMPRERVNSLRNHIKKERERLKADGFTVTELNVTGGVNPLITVPQVQLTAVGSMRETAGEAGSGKASASGTTEILVLGFPGLEGMLRIIGEKEPELKQRFAATFLDQMKACRGKLISIGILHALMELNAVQIRPMGEGGIFVALWELSEDTGLGFDIDLLKIPLLQETIEICEYYRINPYQLASAGSVLVLTEDGAALKEMLDALEVRSDVIGRLADGTAKRILNNGEVRYLDRPAADELYRVLKERTEDA